MKVFKHFPIGYKLVLIIMLMCASVLVLSSAVFYNNYRINYHDALVDDMFAQADQISASINKDLVQDKNSNVIESLQTLKKDPRISRLVVFNEHDVVVGSYTNYHTPTEFNPDLALPSSDIMTQSLLELKKQPFLHSFTGNFLNLFSPVVLDGQVIGSIYIQTDLQELIVIRDRLIHSLVLIFFISLLAGSVISLLGQRILTRPILNLLNTMRLIADRNDYTIRAEKISNDELGDLIDGFNAMIERIDRHDKEQIEAQQQIRKLAYHDTLTNLPNRAFFKELLQQTLTDDNELKLSVLYIDLDNFKLTNDSMGHNAGDKLLQVFTKRTIDTLRNITAEINKTAVPRVKTTLSRLGGDDFTVIIRNSSTLINEQISQSLIKSQKEPYILNDTEVFVSVSIGISRYPDDGKDVEALLKNADAAMNHAKEHGKNNIQIYNKSLQAIVAHKFALENELRRALENDELMLHYQPKLSLHTNKIIGVEGLARWNHPQRGLILPSEFVPVAEETGQIIDIGLWALKAGCLQCRRWHLDGYYGMRIAINLSARQFCDENLLNHIKQALTTSQLDPHFLEIELTESMIMTPDIATIDTLHQLKDLGVHISIDDFGTGYSSLRYLNQFPLDTIKIDRSFVTNITRSHSDASITNAIISLGNNLNLSVIAEGVETMPQLEHLRTSGCDEVQGYLISNPQPAHKICKLFNQYSGQRDSKKLEFA